MREIYKAANLKKKQFTPCFNKVKDVYYDQWFKAVTIDQVTLAERVCNKEGFPWSVCQDARIAQKNIESLKILEGRMPQTISAVAIKLVVDNLRVIDRQGL